MALVKATLALAVLGGAGFFVATMPATVQGDALKTRTANLANGETMYNIGGCFSCHGTENQPDRRKLGGGHELKTPFGVFVVPNISSDPKHGIGGWTELQFVNAMLKGVGRNGEHLFPAFPYASYQRMAINDVRDLFAYMKTLPAVATPSPAHRIAFPFNVRRSLGGWKLLFLDGKPFTPDPKLSAELNRGAYLVEGPGHCAECHSGRNALGGIIAEQRMAGGADAEGKGWVPNITPHENGLAKWSQKDIEYLLESGFTPNNDSVGSSMASVIENTSKLSPEDRRAMAAYLKSLPPRPGARAPKAQ
jgi:mono/diheme cytochrome c family protein